MPKSSVNPVPSKHYTWFLPSLHFHRFFYSSKKIHKKREKQTNKQIEQRKLGNVAEVPSLLRLESPWSYACMCRSERVLCFAFACKHTTADNKKKKRWQEQQEIVRIIVNEGANVLNEPRGEKERRKQISTRVPREDLPWASVGFVLVWIEKCTRTKICGYVKGERSRPATGSRQKPCCWMGKDRRVTNSNEWTYHHAHLFHRRDCLLLPPERRKMRCGGKWRHRNANHKATRRDFEKSRPDESYWHDKFTGHEAPKSAKLTVPQLVCRSH